jgi:hypothetical protein
MSTSRGQAWILPMRDLGEHQLSEADIRQYYPVVPKTVRGTVFILHPLRYLPPAGDYFFLPYADTIWPEASTNRQRYCFHCFTFDGGCEFWYCKNTCGCCGKRHPALVSSNNQVPPYRTCTNQCTGILPQSLQHLGLMGEPSCD